MSDVTERKTRALSRRVPMRFVKSRFQDGRQLSYIEGWYAIDRANQIFGFDRWDRETIEVRCIHTRHDRNSSATAIYVARVRVTVRTETGVAVRDGHGTGEATASALGDAHDRAVKAAETDATKRALATFGKAFGLALYAGLKPTAAPHDPFRAQPPQIAHSPAATVSPTKSPERRTSLPLKVADSVPAVGTTLQAAPTQVKASNGSSIHGGHASRSAHTVVPTRIISRKGPSSPCGPIDKSVLALPEPLRQRDKGHLRYVASQPCLLCGKAPSDAHHLRFAQPRALGKKVSDEFTVPLCRDHHAELHREGNEVAWWHDMGIDPLTIADDLWAGSHSADPASHANAKG